MSVGELPGNVESTNLSRDNLSREIGRSGVRQNSILRCSSTKRC